MNEPINPDLSRTQKAHIHKFLTQKCIVLNTLFVEKWQTLKNKENTTDSIKKEKKEKKIFLPLNQTFSQTLVSDSTTHENIINMESGSTLPVTSTNNSESVPMSVPDNKNNSNTNGAVAAGGGGCSTSAETTSMPPQSWPNYTHTPEENNLHTNHHHNQPISNALQPNNINFMQNHLNHANSSHQVNSTAPQFQNHIEALGNSVLPINNSVGLPINSLPLNNFAINNNLQVGNLPMGNINPATSTTFQARFNHAALSFPGMHQANYDAVSSKYTNSYFFQFCLLKQSNSLQYSG